MKADINKLNLPKGVNAVVLPIYDRYVVTSDGRVFSFAKDKNGKEMSFKSKVPGAELKDEYGISLFMQLNILIAMCFLGCPKDRNRCIVLFKDGDQTNFKVDNLQWVHLESKEYYEFKIPTLNLYERDNYRNFTNEQLTTIINLIREGYGNKEISDKVDFEIDVRYISAIRHHRYARELWTEEELKQGFMQSDSRKGIGANQSEFTLEEQIEIWNEIQTNDDLYIANKYNMDRSRVRRIRKKEMWKELHAYLENSKINKKERLPSSELIEFVSLEEGIRNEQSRIKDYKKKIKESVKARNEFKNKKDKEKDLSFESRLNEIRHNLDNYSRYIIYPNGKVYDNHYGKYAELIKIGNYYGYSLYNDFLKKNTAVMLHRLLMLKFKPRKDYNCVINHKDGDKENNSFKNLEWVTQQENMMHSDLMLGKKWLNSIYEFKQLIIEMENGYSVLDLAIKYQCHEGHVRNIKKRQRLVDVYDMVKKEGIPKIKYNHISDFMLNYRKAIIIDILIKDNTPLQYYNMSKLLVKKILSKKIWHQGWKLYKMLFEKSIPYSLTEREERIIKTLNGRNYILSELIEIERYNNDINLLSSQIEFYNIIHKEYPDVMFKYDYSINRNDMINTILKTYKHTELIKTKTNILYRTIKEELNDKDQMFQNFVKQFLI